MADNNLAKWFVTKVTCAFSPPMISMFLAFANATRKRRLIMPRYVMTVLYS